MKSIFNPQRFLQLVKWSLVTDSAYNKKQVVMLLAIICFFGQSDNLFHTNGVGDMTTGMFTAILLTMIGTGGSYMFASFRDRIDGIRDLNMLPASNLEKFLARYLVSFLFHVMVVIVSMVVSDVLQYAVGLLIGRQNIGFVLPDVLGKTASALTKPSVLILFLWSHSFFMVGANFFRNVKYNWALTALTMLIIVIAAIIIFPHSYLKAFVNTGQEYVALRQELNTFIAVGMIVLIVLSLLNVWLAYRLFCRRQLIGKFINL